MLHTPDVILPFLYHVLYNLLLDKMPYQNQTPIMKFILLRNYWKGSCEHLSTKTVCYDRVMFDCIERCNQKHPSTYTA